MIAVPSPNNKIPIQTYRTLIIASLLCACLLETIIITDIIAIIPTDTRRPTTVDTDFIADKTFLLYH